MIASGEPSSVTNRPAPRGRAAAPLRSRGIHSVDSPPVTRWTSGSMHAVEEAVDRAQDLVEEIEGQADVARDALRMSRGDRLRKDLAQEQDQHRHHERRDRDSELGRRADGSRGPKRRTRRGCSRCCCRAGSSRADAKTRPSGRGRRRPPGRRDSMASPSRSWERRPEERRLAAREEGGRRQATEDDQDASRGSTSAGLAKADVRARRSGARGSEGDGLVGVHQGREKLPRGPGASNAARGRAGHDPGWGLEAPAGVRSLTLRVCPKWATSAPAPRAARVER